MTDNENIVAMLKSSKKLFRNIVVYDYDTLKRHMRDVSEFVKNLDESEKFRFIKQWEGPYFNIPGKLDQIIKLFIEYIDDPALILYVVYKYYDDLDNDLKKRIDFRISSDIFDTLFRLSSHMNIDKFVSLEIKLKRNGIIDKRWNGKYIVPDTYQNLLDMIKNSDTCIDVLSLYQNYLIDNPNVMKKLLESGCFIYDGSQRMEDNYGIIGQILWEINNKYPADICSIIQAWKVSKGYDHRMEKDLMYVINKNTNEPNNIKILGNMNPIIYFYRFYNMYTKHVRNTYDIWAIASKFESIIRPKIHYYLSMIKDNIDEDEYQSLLNALFIKKIIKSETSVVLPENLSMLPLKSILETMYISHPDDVVQYLLINPNKFTGLYSVIDEKIILDVLPYLNEQYMAITVMSSNRVLESYPLLDPLIYILSICGRSGDDIDLNEDYLPSDKEDRHRLLLRCQQYISIELCYELIKELKLIN